MKKVEVINNRYFSGIERFLKFNFEEFEILEANYQKGKYCSFDGVGGYLDKPTLDIIVIGDKEKYSFNFYMDANHIGNYWYWIMTTFEDGTPRKSTRYFENWKDEIVIEKATEYKSILKDYIAEV